jgi:hypothetical protein
MVKNLFEGVLVDADERRLTLSRNSQRLLPLTITFRGHQPINYSYESWE